MTIVHYDFGLISSLIEKITEKLPIHSNQSADELISNKLFAENIALLVEMSKHRLGSVLRSLSASLESLFRMVKTNGDDLSSQVSQSLVIVLNIMNECFTNFYAHISTIQMTWELAASPVAPRLSVPGTSVSSGAAESQGAQDLKASLLTRILPIKNQSSLQDAPAKVPFPKPENSFDIMWEAMAIEPQLAASILDVVYAIFSYVLSDQVLDKSVSSPTLATISTSMNIDLVNLHLAVSRVISFISGANWDVTFTKIKNKLQALATSNEEFPDLTDIKLIEHCNLNNKRLAMVMQGMSCVVIEIWISQTRNIIKR
jgi:neurofibromin 1